MSGALPWGREMPRWSVVTPGTATPASMAGLPGSRAWVKVGPPLSASGPSSGSVLTRSVGSRATPGVSEKRLWPSETNAVPASLTRLPPAGLAKILVVAVT